MIPRTRIIAAAALLIGTTCAEWLQGQQASAPGTGLIVGRVVDAKDGSAIAGAIVSLSGPAARKVLVDGQGRFYFNELPAGAFTLTATKARYLDGAFGKQRADGSGRPLELGAGERVTDVTLKMWRVAAITGVVTDDVGEPVSAARVLALRRTFVAGRSRLVSAGTAEADDLGVYRFGALAPGDYFVVTTTYTISVPVSAVAQVDAVRRAGGSVSTDFIREINMKGSQVPLGNLYGGIAMQRLGDVLVAFGVAAAPTAANSAAIAHYSTGWHRAASGPAQATAVTVAPGDERTGVDLHLRLTNSVRVSGVVSGPDGPIANFGLRLVPAGLDDVANETLFFAACLTASAADGSFTFVGVDPGQYTIRALTTVQGAIADVIATPVLWVSTPVSVGEAGLSGVRAVAKVGSRISGRIVYDGTSAPLSAVELGALRVSIEPADGRASAVGFIDPTGRFSTPGLITGRYFVRMRAARGWTLKSAMVGGRDVSDVPLDVGATDVDGVVLTLTDHPPVMTGTVRTAQGNPDAEAIVLVFPSDPAAWIDTGANPRRLRSARPSRAGAFTVTGLPPGDYLAVAVSDASIATWQEPTTLQALSRVASRVRVDENQSASVALVTTVVR